MHRKIVTKYKIKNVLRQHRFASFPVPSPFKKSACIMTEPTNGDWNLYPQGDDRLVPVGVDAKRYFQRFTQNSEWLFISQGDKLEVMRVLSGSGGNLPSDYGREELIIYIHRY
jgi:hypothetical protein